MPLSLRMGLGLTKARTVALPELLPTYVGFGTSKTGNPTMPAHQAGDLIIGAVLRQGSSASVPSNEGWTEWATYTGTGACATVYYKVAADNAEGWGTWSQSGNRRAVWVFRNAQRGFINGDGQDSGEAGTSLVWPNLNNGDAFTESHFLVAAVLNGNAQTAVTHLRPAGVTWASDLVAAPNASGADGELIVISANANVTEWDGDTQTFDTSGVNCRFVFSVKRA